MVYYNIRNREHTKREDKKMKLRSYGYKVAKVETREMTIAELKLAIIEGYVNNGVKEVQLVDITSGDTVTFNSIEDVTRNKWSGNCKIELINLPHGFGTNEDVKAVIIFQTAEDGEEKVIA